MALTATLRRYEITLSDSDRGVYETLEWRAAQHPSETDRYMAARLIARCLEHAEGVDFTKGLDADDEPAIWQKNLRGELMAWIEVGSPSTERLHRASKMGARLVIYAFKQPKKILDDAIAFKAHKVTEWKVIELDPAFLDRIAERTDKVNRWDLAISGGALYLTIGKDLLESSTTLHVAPS
jgi:uncharacterized protein YaeQ